MSITESITEDQKKEIMDFGKVKTEWAVRGSGVYMYKNAYINGKKINLDFIFSNERLFQALCFVSDAQYYIKKGEDIGVGYYYEYENARDWLKEEGIEL